MNTLKVKHYFDAAHQLDDSDLLITKQCAQLHGHTYAVEVIASSDKLNSAGMVIDFKAIKVVIDRLDHKYINDVFDSYGIDLQPTAENIAVVIAEWIMELGLEVTSVAVCEGYKGLEKASWAIYEPSED